MKVVPLCKRVVNSFTLKHMLRPLLFCLSGSPYFCNGRLVGFHCRMFASYAAGRCYRDKSFKYIQLSAKTGKSGPEVIKNSCSTQLCMKL